MPSRSAVDVLTTRVFFLFSLFVYDAVSTTEIAAAEERVRTILEDGRNVPVDRKRVKELPGWFDERLFARYAPNRSASRHRTSRRTV